MIDAQKKIKLSNITDLSESLYPTELLNLGNKFYDAIVTRCIDGDMPRWVKVTVMGITDGLPLKDQPWAEPAPSSEFIVPKPGTFVKVTFTDGDVHLPVWHSAGAQDGGKYNDSFFMRDDYPNNNQLYRHSDGTAISHNAKNGNVTIDTSSGTKISVDKSGMVEITGSGATSALRQKFKTVTNAAICPFLAAQNAAGSPKPPCHPTGADPILYIDDMVGA